MNQMSSVAVVQTEPLMVTAQLVSHFQEKVDEILVSMQTVSSSSNTTYSFSAGSSSRESKESSSKGNYTEIEKAEAFEKLGYAQFYYGSYKQATVTLVLAEAARKKIASSLSSSSSSSSSSPSKQQQQQQQLLQQGGNTRQNALNSVFLGLCWYRLGDVEKAEKCFASVLSLKSFALIQDIAIAAYGNMALLCLGQSRLKEGVDAAKKGYELCVKYSKEQAKEYKEQQQAQIQADAAAAGAATAAATTTTAKGDLITLEALAYTQKQLVEVTRTLFAAYLRAGDFGRCEALLKDAAGASSSSQGAHAPSSVVGRGVEGFDEREIYLLRAGLLFAAGKVTHAHAHTNTHTTHTHTSAITHTLTPFLHIC